MILPPLRFVLGAGPLPTQPFPVLGRPFAGNLPELLPRGLGLASLGRVLRGNVQSPALAFAAIGQIEMRSVSLGGVAIANAAGIAAAAGGFRQSALHHGLGGGQELAQQNMLTHIYYSKLSPKPCQAKSDVSAPTRKRKPRLSAPSSIIFAPESS